MNEHLTIVWPPGQWEAWERFSKQSGNLTAALACNESLQAQEPEQYAKNAYSPEPGQDAVAMPGVETTAQALLDTGIVIGASTWPDENMRDALILARAATALFQPAFASAAKENAVLSDKLRIAMDGLRMISEMETQAAAAIRAQGNGE